MLLMEGILLSWRAGCSQAEETTFGLGTTHCLLLTAPQWTNQSEWPRNRVLSQKPPASGKLEGRSFCVTLSVYPPPWSTSHQTIKVLMQSTSPPSYKACLRWFAMKGMQWKRRGRTWFIAQRSKSSFHWRHYQDSHFNNIRISSRAFCSSCSCARLSLFRLLAQGQ